MQYIQLNLKYSSGLHSSFKIPYRSDHDICKAGRLILSNKDFHYTGFHPTVLVVTDVYFTEASDASSEQLELDKTLMCDLEDESLLNVCMAIEYCMKYYKHDMIIGSIGVMPEEFKPYIMAEKGNISLDDAKNQIINASCINQI